VHGNEGLTIDCADGNEGLTIDCADGNECLTVDCADGNEVLTIDCADVSIVFTSFSAMSYNVIAIVCVYVSKTYNTLFVFMTYSAATHALYQTLPVIDYVS
jgi:hypothetical protein